MGWNPNRHGSILFSMSLALSLSTSLYADLTSPLQDTSGEAFKAACLIFISQKWLLAILSREYGIKETHAFKMLYQLNIFLIIFFIYFIWLFHESCTNAFDKGRWWRKRIVRELTSDLDHISCTSFIGRSRLAECSHVKMEDLSNLHTEMYWLLSYWTCLYWKMHRFCDSSNQS